MVMMSSSKHFIYINFLSDVQNKALKNLYTFFMFNNFFSIAVEIIPDDS